jgi:hypothetical protein
MSASFTYSTPIRGAALRKQLTKLSPLTYFRLFFLQALLPNRLLMARQFNENSVHHRYLMDAIHDCI